jgi:kynurenine formamidase
MSIIDLSAALAPRADEREFVRIEIEYEDHAAGAAGIQQLFGVAPELLRDGEGWAVDTLTHLSTHATTHVDAPCNERGVRVMGIDAWGWDRPLHLQAEDARLSGRQGVFWAAHQVDLEYCRIERLTNLGVLPPTGFTVACFPLKLFGGSAAPARVVAILPD